MCGPQWGVPRYPPVSNTKTFNWIDPSQFILRSCFYSECSVRQAFHVGCATLRAVQLNCLTSTDSAGRVRDRQRPDRPGLDAAVRGKSRNSRWPARLCEHYVFAFFLSARRVCFRLGRVRASVRACVRPSERVREQQEALARWRDTSEIRHAHSLGATDVPFDESYEIGLV